MNALSFTGSIMLKNYQELKQLEDVRLVQMLEDVCELITEDQNTSNDVELKWTWI